jgi:hypothetical protein
MTFSLPILVLKSPISRQFRPAPLTSDQGFRKPTSSKSSTVPDLGGPKPWESTNLTGWTGPSTLLASADDVIE